MRAPVRSIALAGMLTATAALSQDPFDYKGVAANAEALVAQKQFDAAEQMVSSSMARCGMTSPDCAGYLQFTLGYILNSRGDAASLPRAENAYRAAAKVFASNPQIQADLGDVLLQEKKTTEAAQAFEQAALLDPRGAASRYLAGAEAFRHAGIEWQALALYRKAIDKGSPDAATGAVDMMAGWIEHASNPGEREGRIKDTLAIGRDLRNREAFGAAIEAFETVMAYHQETPSFAADALARWTEARASARTLSASALKRLPPDWSTPFLKDLTATVTRGEWTFTDASTTTQFERYAATSAAKAIADGLLVRDDKPRALALYSKAMDRAPLPSEQDASSELKALPVVYLDAAVQIARISTTTKDEAKFRNVEGRLFEGKIQAYESNNLATVQRMHTVLGTIYAERGTWTSPSPYTNATFQLNAALSTARMREKNEGIRQPLPYLHETLAKGYRAQNRPDEAGLEDLSAVRDYLEVDAIAPARTALTRSKGSSSTPAFNASYSTLSSIIDYRANVPTVDWKQKTFSPPEWKLPMTATPTTVIDSGFLARQKFKALADLSSAAKKKGDTKFAAAFSAGAYEAAKGQIFYGTADSLRLIDIKTIDFEKPEKTIEPDEPEVFKYLLEPNKTKPFEIVLPELDNTFKAPQSWQKVFQVPEPLPPVKPKPDSIKSESSPDVKTTEAAATASTEAKEATAATTIKAESVDSKTKAKKEKTKKPDSETPPTPPPL